MHSAPASTLCEKLSMYLERQGEKSRCMIDGGTVRSGLLLHLHLCMLGNDLFRNLPGHFFIMIELLPVDTPPLCHRSKVGGIAEEFLQRNERPDDLMGPVRIHPEDF